MSFATPNYSGALFNKGNERTPFLSMIAGKTAYSNSVEFVLGQDYTSEEGDIPAISEKTSLTAPDATLITRKQNTNVTQIFQESIGISYAKMSNMGTLSGANIAGQSANPRNELDFQTSNKLKKIARSIEKTCIQGKYNKATTDETINKTRGMVEAITTNTVAAGNKPLDIWMVNEAMEKVYNSNGDISRLTLLIDGVTLNQINASAVDNGLTIVPQTRNENGIQITKLIMPMGQIDLMLGQFLPAGTALLVNFDVIRPIEMIVPGKGNFFRELLAKTGAGEKYQIFGQFGLDYANELYHAKITGISTTFTKPEGRKVYVMNADEFPSGGVGA